MKNQYETKHLSLIRSEPGLALEVCKYYLRNKTFFEKYESSQSDNFFTVEYYKKSLIKDQEKCKKLSGIRFWIKHREYNKLIGMVALNEVVFGAFQSAFLSFKLDKDALNQGYMTEAVAAVVKVAFNELNLHRLEANIMPSNLASIRVVEKLGFYKEGIGKDYLYINGVWEDHIHMVLLNTSWMPSSTVPIPQPDFL